MLKDIISKDVCTSRVDDEGHISFSPASVDLIYVKSIRVFYTYSQHPIQRKQ